MPDPKPTQLRRAPAPYRTIANITPGTDIRVRLLGRVIGIADGTVVIDDGTGRADVIADDCPVQEQDLVRVFARVLPLESGYELRAELFQPMQKLDVALYQKVFLD